MSSTLRSDLAGFSSTTIGERREPEASILLSDTTRTGGVAGELEHAEGVIGLEPDAVVDVKAGVLPGEHEPGPPSDNENVLEMELQHWNPEPLHEIVVRLAVTKPRRLY